MDMYSPMNESAGIKEVDGSPPAEFRLYPDGLSDNLRKRAITRFQELVFDRRARFLGYQANQKLAYAEDLAPFMNCQLNNIGDPFVDSNFGVNSKLLEREVLDYFAKLWHAETPHDPLNPDSYWGYVLSMGATEGNLYGLWNAREYLSGRRIQATGDLDSSHRRALVLRPKPNPDAPNAHAPVVFYSQDTHYSLIKIVRMLGLKTFYEMGTGRDEYRDACPLPGGWPSEVPSVGGDKGPGSIDIDSLESLVEFFARRGHPVIVNFNVGTTFKGACDNVAEAGSRLLPIFDTYGLNERRITYNTVQDDDTFRSGYWIHVDGALGAGHLPWLEMAKRQGRFGQEVPVFDFRLPFVHSISVSGHKSIGAPWPCGVFMARTGRIMKPPSDPEYVLGADTTLSGSRNGFSALILWNYLAKHSYDHQVDKALAADSLAQYALEKLRDASHQLGRDLWAERSPLSLTVRFRRPSERIISKYSLSCENLGEQPNVRRYAHLFAMEHVTRELIDELVDDLISDVQSGDADLQWKPEVAQLNPMLAEALFDVPQYGRGFL